MCCADVLSLILNDHIVVTDEVVVAVPLDELVCELLYIVNVEVSVNRTILLLRLYDDHLTVSIELVITCLKVGSLKIRCLDVLGNILNDSVVICDKVVAAIYFNKLISSKTFTIIIDVIAVYTVKLSLPYTILTKEVPLGFYCVVSKCNFLYTGINMTYPCKVPLTLDLFPTTGYRLTCPVEVRTGFGLDPMSIDLDLVSKLIGLTVNGKESLLECLEGIGLEVVIVLILICLPTGNEFAKLSVVEVVAILNEAEVLSGCICIVDTSIGEYANYTVNELYAGESNTVNEVHGVISGPTVSNNYTVNIGLTIGVNTVEYLTACASKNTVNYRVAVSGCGDNSTPIDYGAASTTVTPTSNVSGSVVYVLLSTAITLYAEDSAGVTSSSTGSSKILRLTCYMDVRADLALSVLKSSSRGIFLDPVPVLIKMTVSAVAVHLSMNENLIGSEGLGCLVNKGNLTCNDLSLDSVHTGTVGHPHTVRSHHLIRVNQSGVSRNYAKIDKVRISPTGKCPETNGKLCKNSLTGKLNITGTGDSKSSSVKIINSILSLKAICKLHALKLPDRDAVEVDGSSYRLDVLDTLCHEVKILNRSKRNVSCVGISSCKVDISVVSIYNNLTLDKSEVSCVILNLKTESMSTVGKLYAISDNGTVSRAGNIADKLNSINIYSCALGVDAGSVDHSSVLFCVRNNCDLVLRDSLTVHNDLAVSSLRNIDIIECRNLSIFYCIGEVSSNVINIENSTVVGVPVCITGIGNTNTDSRNLSHTCGNSTSDVIPTVTGRSYVTFTKAGTFEHCSSFIYTIGVSKSRHTVKTEVDIIHFLYRYIHPHTNICSPGNINGRHMYHKVLPTCSGRNAEISINSKSLLTIAN